MHEVSLSGAERFHHSIGRAPIHYFDLAPVGAVMVNGVLQHGQRLPAMVGQ